MRKSKLICELIFIFLLPLVFLSFNISINQDYVYDENGNFKTSGLNVEMNNINFVNEVKDVHHGVEYIYYSWQEWFDVFNSNNYTHFYFDFNHFKFKNFYFIYLQDGNFCTSYLCSLVDSINHTEYYLQLSFDSNFDDIRILLLDVSDEVVFNFGRFDYTYSFDSSNFDIYFQYYVDDWDDDIFDVSSFDINSSIPCFFIKEVIQVDEYHYKNPIYEVCVQLDNYIGFDSTSTTMQIINAYTTLWVLMFFIWHLLYMFLDFFPHLFERKRE